MQFIESEQCRLTTQWRLAGSEFQVCVLDKVLDPIQYQCIGDAVLFGVFQHMTLEKAEVDDMDFCIVLHRELGKGVAIGVFNEQEPATPTAALNDGLRLIRVQKHRVLVAAVKVFALIDAVRFILPVVIRNGSVRVLVPCCDLLSGDGGQGDFIPSRAVEIIAEDLLYPLPLRRLNVPPRTVSSVQSSASCAFFIKA